MARTVAASVRTLAGSPAPAAAPSSWVASFVSVSWRFVPDSLPALSSVFRAEEIVPDARPFDRSSWSR